MALRNRVKKGFTPFRAPWGTYDPSIDAQQGAADRGYTDLTADYGFDAQGNPTGRLTQRAQSDYHLGLADLGRQGDYATQDFATSRAGVDTSSGRSLADVLTARARGAQDYASATQGIQRNYAERGAQQTEQASAAGVGAGGSLAAALKARAAGQGIDQGAVDTNYNRFTQDSATAQQRIGQDQATALAGIATDESRTLGPDGSLARGVANLGLGYNRGVQDAGVTLQRGGREHGAFTADAANQRLYEGRASGLLPGRGMPGGPPANEFVDQQGPYQIVVRGGQRFKVRPDGTQVSAGRRRRR